MSCDLFIFAGEKSGDLHGEELIRSLHEKNPDLKIAGVGGPRMRKTAFECLLPMERFQTMGFIDVLVALPRLVRLFFQVKKLILSSKPKAVIFIDYADFNLKMAKALRKKSFKGKLIHYICPTVWAWRKGRIKPLAKNLDLLLTILPFEPKCFEKTSLQAEYVGHPLIHKPRAKKEPHFLSLFPGSRTVEIERNLPLQIKLAKETNLPLALSIASEKHLPLIKKIIGDEKIELFFPDRTYELMSKSRLALATSGTVNLELALHEVPTIVTFAIRPLDLFIARRLFRIDLPHYCLVNILLNERLFPELYGPNLTEENLRQAIKSFLDSPEHQNSCIERCVDLKALLGTQKASSTAAQLILKKTLTD